MHVRAEKQSTELAKRERENRGAVFVARCC
jgi:hypothetical protein